MTISKITSPIQPLDLIDKTNEIIDNLAVWGNITGTLSDQTDLQNVLNSIPTVTEYTASEVDTLWNSI